MPSTPRGFRYPALTDVPDGAAQIKALADDADVRGFAPAAFSVDPNATQYPGITSFAAASARPGLVAVSAAQADGPVPGTLMISETRQYQGGATWVLQYAWSPFGGSVTGPDARVWSRQMYGASGNTWSPWKLIQGAVTSGTVGFGNVAAGGVTGTSTITFPTGLFSATPNVGLAVVAPTPKVTACLTALSASSCSILAINNDTVVRAVQVTVVASQA